MLYFLRLRRSLESQTHWEVDTMTLNFMVEANLLFSSENLIAVRVEDRLSNFSHTKAQRIVTSKLYYDYLEQQIKIGNFSLQ